MPVTMCIIIFDFDLMQEVLLNNKGLQLANQNVPSAAGPAHKWSLTDNSTEVPRAASNGATQPNVPACKFLFLRICMKIYLFIILFIF